MTGSITAGCVMICVVVVGITVVSNVVMLPSELMKTVSAFAGKFKPVTAAATAIKPNTVFFILSPPRG